MKKIAIGEKYGDLTVIGRDADFTGTSGHSLAVWVCECEKHHRISYRTESVKNGKCPFCSYNRLLVGFNDLCTLYPKLVAEWDYEKNADLKPYQFTPRSHQKIWWKCNTCGDSWKTEIYVRVKGHGCPYCASKKASSRNNLLLVAPELAAEWNYDKNGDLSPKNYAPNSQKMVWWRCSRGHEWKATIQNRFLGRGCRVCSAELKSSFPEQAIRYYLNKIVEVRNRYRIGKWELDVFIPSFNIGIEYDGLAWHLTDERLIDREIRKDSFFKKTNIRLIRVKETKELKPNSDSVVFLEIAKSGYKYINLDKAILSLLQIVKSITGINTYVDVNHERDRADILNSYINLQKKNSLANAASDSLIFWNKEKNRGLTPYQFTEHSNHVVWWKCPVCGGEWEKSIIAFRNGERCPYCSGHRLLVGYNDLKTLYPDIANEWDYDKNHGLSPETIYAKSSKRVWWKCSNGHSWSQTLTSRISKHTGCPICAGKKVNTLGKKRVDEWYKRFLEAKLYYDTYGNLIVPINYISPSGLKLGIWIQSQRTKFNNGNLVEERKNKLDSIGMVWKVKRGPKK